MKSSRNHKLIETMPKINTIYRKNQERERVQVTLHSVTTQGSTIVHAETGDFMGCVFGTSDEDYLFRLKYCVGDTEPYYEPVDLFYYSPEEAEQHLFMKISNDTKERFRERQQLLAVRKV